MSGGLIAFGNVSVGRWHWLAGHFQLQPRQPISEHTSPIIALVRSWSSLVSGHLIDSVHLMESGHFVQLCFCKAHFHGNIWGVMLNKGLTG